MDYLRFYTFFCSAGSKVETECNANCFLIKSCEYKGKQFILVVLNGGSHGYYECFENSKEIYQRQSGWVPVFGKRDRCNSCARPAVKRRSIQNPNIRYKNFHDHTYHRWQNRQGHITCCIVFFTAEQPFGF